MKNILVYGATGDQGIPLIAALLAAGLNVRAASRKPDPLTEASFAAVETVRADFNDPDSLLKASESIDGIAMNLPFIYDVAKIRKIAANILRAAVAQGVKKVIFNTSCVVMDRDLGIGAHDGRRAVEQEIENSGLIYAIIRPTVFMDNLTRSWVKPSIVRNNLLAYPAAERLQVSWICLEDVAKCMVAALLNTSVVKEKFLVGGPQALTGSDLTEILSREAGRKIVFKSISPDIFAGAMRKLVSGSEQTQANRVYDGMAKFYNWYNSQPESPLIANNIAARDALGIALTPFAEWVKRTDWSNL